MSTAIQKSRYDTKRDIVALFNHGVPAVKIAEETVASRSNVHRVIARYKKEGHVHYHPRSGRPSALSKADKNGLSDIVEEHSSYPLCEITKASGLNISPTTVDKALKEAGFTLHIKHKKPFLKLHHKRARME